MKGDIYWTEREFPGRIALISRPRGGDWLEDEATAWSEAGLDVIVSMLEESEIDEFELDRESEITVARGIEFISYPVPDRSVPMMDDRFFDLTDHLRSSLLAGKNIGIHCRQSVGRAPLLAAALMVAEDIDVKDAIAELSIARGRTVPETTEQEDWLKNFAHNLALVHT